MLTDKTIICKDCGKEFIFSAGEQEFFVQKGFESAPQRCRECRALRKRSKRPAQKRLYEIVCARCGAVESIPFEPKHDKPVYCNRCYVELNQR